MTLRSLPAKQKRNSMTVTNSTAVDTQLQPEEALQRSQKELADIKVRS